MSARWMTDETTRTGRSALRDEIHLSWDGGDPWGSALSVGFAACDVLHFTGGGVPTEADHSPSLGGLDEESYPDSMFLETLVDGTITHGDLSYWARVISRYLDRVPEDRRY